MASSVATIEERLVVGIAALIRSNVSETREENDWNAIVFFFVFFLVGPCEAVAWGSLLSVGRDAPPRQLTRPQTRLPIMN